MQTVKLNNVISKREERSVYISVYERIPVYDDIYHYVYYDDFRKPKKAKNALTGHK